MSGIGVTGYTSSLISVALRQLRRNTAALKHCGRTHTSAVRKHSKAESESSPTTTCNVCIWTISLDDSDTALFNTTKLIRRAKLKHLTEHKFAQVMF